MVATFSYDDDSINYIYDIISKSRYDYSLLEKYQLKYSTWCKITLILCNDELFNISIKRCHNDIQKIMNFIFERDLNPSLNIMKSLADNELKITKDMIVNLVKNFDYEDMGVYDYLASKCENLNSLLEYEQTNEYPNQHKIDIIMKYI